MLSMRGGYLATESLRDILCGAGSRNNSGITVKKGAEHSGLKSQSANIWGSVVQGCGRLRNVEDILDLVLTNNRALKHARF